MCEQLEIRIAQGDGIGLDTRIHHVVADLAEGVIVPEQDGDRQLVLHGRAQFIDGVLQAIVANQSSDGLLSTPNLAPMAAGSAKPSVPKPTGCSHVRGLCDGEYLIGRIRNLRHVGGDDGFIRQCFTDHREHLGKCCAQGCVVAKLAPQDIHMAAFSPPLH